MLVYVYDASGLFVSEYNCQLYNGEYIIPTLSTTIAPPFLTANQTVTFANSVWTVIDDFRGQMWFDKVTALPVEITSVGTPPSTLVAVQPVLPVPIPTNVTSAQAKIALVNANLYSQVLTIIASAPLATQIAWSDATAFDRSSPTLATLASALNLTSKQVDDLFIAADKVVI